MAAPLYNPLDTTPFRTYTTNMHPLKRNLYEKATQMLAMFPVVAILGARQCGKTTFAKLHSLETFIIEHKCPFGIVVNNADHIAWVRPNIVQIPIGYI